MPFGLDCQGESSIQVSKIDYHSRVETTSKKVTVLETRLTDTIAPQAEITVEFYNSINALKTPSELYKRLRQFAEAFHFERYVALNIPQITEENIKPSFIASNWPTVLTSEYDRMRLLENSPIVEGLRKQDLPIAVDLEKDGIRRPDEEKSIATKLFLDNGMARGIFIPCHDRTGRRGAIGFAGMRSLPSPSESALLHMASMYAFSRLFVLINELSNKLVLSSRELECLVWSARGKTSAECAVILGVAESTVAGYLSALNRKLHAQNKTQMIAIAYELGLISNANINLR